MERDGAYHPTNGYLLLNGDTAEFPDAAIQCAVFKSRADISSPAKEFTGAIYEQIEDAYNFVLQQSTSAPASKASPVRITMSCRSRPSAR